MDEYTDDFTTGYREGFVKGYDDGISDGRIQGWKDAKKLAYDAFKGDSYAVETLELAIGEL